MVHFVAWHILNPRHHFHYFLYDHRSISSSLILVAQHPVYLTLHRPCVNQIKTQPADKFGSLSKRYVGESIRQ